jgi:hypothetical protein
VQLQYRVEQREEDPGQPETLGFANDACGGGDGEVDDLGARQEAEGVERQVAEVAELACGGQVARDRGEGFGLEGLRG